MPNESTDSVGSLARRVALARASDDCRVPCVLAVYLDVATGWPEMKNKTKALQRSKAYLERNGWQVAIVEKWIPPRGKMKFGVRIDVWGFGDLLACFPATTFENTPMGPIKVPGKVALVQTFPQDRWKDHLEKLESIPEVKTWRDSGGIVYLHGWAFKPKNGVRGAKKVWTLREAFFPLDTVI